MDLSTAFGLIIGFGLIVLAILGKQGDISSFLDPSSIAIVLGGTFAATLEIGRASCRERV